MEVAKAPFAAPGDDEFLPVLLEVAEHLVGRRIENQGAHGDSDAAVRAVPAMLVPATSAISRLRLPLGLEPKVDKAGLAMIRIDHNIAPLAAVAAVRAAVGNKLLAAETGAARATMTRLNCDSCLVDEHTA